jgi:hypothetical protein
MKERIPVKGREHPAECHLETENAQERRKGTQGAEDAVREGKDTRGKRRKRRRRREDRNEGTI